MTDGPRLYLDTADLIGIADRNRVSEVTIDRLINACETTQTTLVVSLWHVADVRSAPPDSARRVIEVVGRFAHRGLIGLDDNGASVAHLESLADLVDENPHAVHLLNGLVSFFTDIEQSIDLPNTPIPERLKNLGGKIALAMLAEESEEDALRVGREMLHKHRRLVPAERHDMMVQTIVHSPIRNLRSQLRTLGVWDSASVADAMRKREASASAVHVGKHVGILVDQRRRAQRDRCAQDGDLADRQHVQFAPYVDIFTGDKDLCGWLDEWRSKVRYERNVKAIHSNRLDAVTTAIETLRRSETGELA